MKKIKINILVSFICLLFANSLFAQFYEGFEGTVFPPTGWVVTNNGIGLNKTWQKASAFGFGGGGAAFCDNENVTDGTRAQDWLITPLILVPNSSNATLQFQAKETQLADFGNIYKVLLSTTGQNISDFTVVLADWDESNINSSVYEWKSISLSNYAGQNVYIAFVMENDNGDRWMLDNINVVTQCYDPSSIVSTNIGMDRITFDWVENNAATTEWEVKLLKNDDFSEIVPAYNVNSKPITFQGLQPGVSYRFVIKSICDNNQLSPGIAKIATTMHCNNFAANETSLTTTQLSWVHYQNNISRTIKYYPIDEPNNFQQIIANFAAVSGPDLNGLFNFSTTITNLDPNKFYVYQIDSPCDSSWTTINGSLLPCSTFRDTNSVLFIDFLNDVLDKVNSGQSNLLIPGYNSIAFNNFKHLIAFSNPSIYNFQNVGGVISFSFTNNSIPDISFDYDSSFGNFTLISPNFTKNNILFENVNCNFEFQNNKKITFDHINLCTEPLGQCTISNTYTDNVKSLTVDFLNSVINQSSIAPGSTNTALNNLAPFLIYSNPAIYNFENPSNNTAKATRLTFSNVSNPLISDLDVQFYHEQNKFPIKDLLLKNYNSANSQIEFDYVFGDDYITSGNIKTNNLIKGVKFCEESCTATNPNSPIVKQLFTNLINDITQTLVSGGTINSSYNSVHLQNLTPYITVTNPGIYNFNVNYNTDGSIFNFEFTFSNTITSPGYDVNIEFGNSGCTTMTDFDSSTYYSPNVMLDRVASFNNTDSCAKIYLRYIDLCPDEFVSCTVANPNTPHIQKLLLNLLSHLIQRKLNGDSDALINGSVPPQLTVLAPYITDPDPVGIHHFVSTYNSYNQLTGFSFSFSPDHGPDINISGGSFYNINSNNFQFDLSNYNDAEDGINIVNYNYGNFLIKDGFIKHVEFCPDELFCKHHVAIVVDESGSIDNFEKEYIKRQLKSFIDKQYQDNLTLGTNMHVYLIGLSDSDTNNRTDNIILNQKVDGSNISQFNQWINGYGSRGVSPNADYWKSGLDLALTIPDVELVILITDGSQTNDPAGLQNTVRQFNNNGGGNGNPNAPHLYVIGIDNGFYVDNPDSVSSAYNRVSNLQNPNLNPELSRSSANGRVTSYLRKSLKYLMEFSDTPHPQFPITDQYNFISRPTDATGTNYEMVDYFGTDTFRFLYENLNYLSNGLVDEEVALSCGDFIPLDVCNNCINFQLEKDKEYILSAWVKEEQNLQVKSYENPEIHVSFKDINEGFIAGSLTVCSTKGDIIDGWQRVFKTFIVPANAAYINIELVNKSTNTPVYFDDIRIHPKDGSMKSFVYDPETFRLMSELDENNYSTFYEYDKEGGLIRVKKETSRGIKTIQETRSGNVIKVEN